MTASAQTNATTKAVDSLLALATTNPPPPPTNDPVMPQSRGPTTITALGPADFDLNNHWTIYRDHVCVSNAQVTLSCDWVKAVFPQNWQRPTNIVAETNVVIDYIAQNGQKTRATGDRAVDIYQEIDGVTNDTITLTGNPLRWPRIEQSDGYMTSDKFTWDRTGGHFYVDTNFEMKGYPNVAPPQGLKNSHNGTNSMEMRPGGTNAPPPQKSSDE